MAEFYIHLPNARSFAMRLLLLAPNFPLPPVSGTQQRTNVLHRALTDLGEVHRLVIGRHYILHENLLDQLRSDFGLVGVHKPDLPGDRWPWRAARAFGASAPSRLLRLILGAENDFQADPASAALFQRLNEKYKYDVIVSRYMSPLASVRPYDHCTTPVLVDIDDLPSELVATRMAQIPPRGVRRWYWHRLAISTRQLNNGLSSVVPTFGSPSQRMCMVATIARCRCWRTSRSSNSMPR
jgi:hypothetical protein